jgi:hypothetical protein
MESFKEYLLEGYMSKKAHDHMVSKGFKLTNPVDGNAKAPRLYHNNDTGETAKVSPDGRYAELYDSKGVKSGQIGFKNL